MSPFSPKEYRHQDFIKNLGSLPQRQSGLDKIPTACLNCHRVSDLMSDRHILDLLAPWSEDDAYGIPCLHDALDYLRFVQQEER